MKREHLEAILWLRWKLTLRGLRRGSPLGAALAAVIAVVSVVSAVFAFGLALVLGLVLSPHARPEHWLFVWGGLALGFLLFWAVGIMVELQRSEPFSLMKLLPFPVPLRGAFLLNYASSFVSLTLVVVGPLMIGLSLALIWTIGAGQLVLFPLIAAFVFMVTAVTYQFRGWIARLMADKRRRGTVVALVTLVFVLVANAPNLFLAVDDDDREAFEDRHREAVSGVMERGRAGGASEAETNLELERLREERREVLAEREKQDFERRFQAVRTASLVLPVGWLPYAAWAAVENRYWPALAATLGMVAIGALSLRRSYRTTLRFYRGEGGGVASRPARRRRKKAGPARGARFLERRIPGCSEAVAVTALAGSRAMWRSPQVKMLLLSPLIVIVVLVATLFGRRDAPLPEAVVPLIALGIAGLTMLTLVGLTQNLFGYDGGGFRVFVLSAAPRSEILLGKNLSIAPFALALGVVGIVLVAILSPMRTTHTLASVAQLCNIYLICCMLGNLISILGPMAMSPGSLKPLKPPAGTRFKQFLFGLLIPLSTLPSGVALGIEELWRYAGSGPVPPVYLLLSALELALLLWIYRRALVSQGRLLSAREQRVLAVVGAAVD